MNKLMQRVVFDRADLWLAAAAVLLVIGWRSWVVAHKPAHAREIADEIASIGPFYGGLYPNHANTHLVFGLTGESGVDIFFCDTSGGRRKLVCEQKEKGFSWQYFGMLGWSPDDSLFACALPSTDPKRSGEEILICNGDTGDVVTKLVASVFLSEFTWLTPHSFAYTFWDGDSHDVAVIEQKSDKEWVRAQVFKQIGNEKMTGLIATSPNSIAWRQGASIWALDFASAASEKIWESTANQLVDFTYSDETKEFLLNCSDEKGQFLTRFYPRTKWTADAGRISDQPNNIIQNVIWFNQGTKYAYLDNEHGRFTVCIKANTNSGLARLPWQGVAYNCTLNGDCLYVTGNTTNDPPAIWECDLNSRDLNCIASSSERPLHYAGILTPTGGVLTNSSGQQRNYFLLHPAHVSPEKKYPVIISQTISAGAGTYPQIAANEGYYFATVSRPSWWEGLDSWVEDVMSIYAILAKNPNIDTNRVFLSGASAETPYMNQLLVEKPDSWKGVILTSPTVLPDLSTVRLSSMFIVAGADDGDSLERLTKYQDQAADAGIFVKLVFLKDAPHVTRSTTSGREQLRQFAKFMSEN